jgi:hypothetical protein
MKARPSDTLEAKISGSWLIRLVFPDNPDLIPGVDRHVIAGAATNDTRARLLVGGHARLNRPGNQARVLIR